MSIGGLHMEPKCSTEVAAPHSTVVVPVPEVRHDPGPLVCQKHRFFAPLAQNSNVCHLSASCVLHFPSTYGVQTFPAVLLHMNLHTSSQESSYKSSNSKRFVGQDIHNGQPRMH